MKTELRPGFENTKFALRVTEEHQPEVASFLHEFIKSDIFAKFLNAARKDIKSEHGNTPAYEIERCVAGALFEALGFWFYFGVLEKDGKILISPDVTVKIFERLYLKRRIAEKFPNLSFGIKGYSIPDGVVCRVSHTAKAVLESWVEYKSGDITVCLDGQYKVYENNLLRDKFDTFSKLVNPSLSRLAAIIQDTYRNFPSIISLPNGKIPVTYVVPSDARLPAELSKEHVIRVPVNKNIFGLLVSHVYADLANEINPQVRVSRN